MAQASSPVTGVLDDVEVGDTLIAKKNRLSGNADIMAHLDDNASVACTVLLQKQFRDDSSWHTIATILTADLPYDKIVKELEDGTGYRFNMTVDGGGAINYRLAHQGG